MSEHDATVNQRHPLKSRVRPGLNTIQNVDGRRSIPIKKENALEQPRSKVFDRIADFARNLFNFQC
ncbi:hypothetical protein [Acidithiobacillus sp.]|uniref:hypothetical protein n=1 Tax=Acidithiobacillus sp. TaxID=1872118 RepID=UPI0025BB0F69|nr:hypothetical protein [Acidithiobacillus sp.]